MASQEEERQNIIQHDALEHARNILHQELSETNMGHGPQLKTSFTRMLCGKIMRFQSVRQLSPVPFLSISMFMVG